VALETGVDLPRALEVVASLPSSTDVLLPRLCDYLSGADPTASGTGKVMDALADLGDPAAVPAIVGILRALGPAGPTWPIWSALRALSAFGAASAPALSLIRPLADRGDTRHLAVDVLWTVGRDPGETLPPLLRMLDDDVPSEFRQAADVLAEIGPAAAPALPGLRRRLSDPYHWTKVSAARAVWAIGGETEAPAVIDALVRAAAEEPVTIKHAVECFARMAAVGSPALARLRAELDDPAAGPHDERLHPRAAGGRFADDETLRATAQSVLTQVDDAGSVMP
jgi:HEAT repeat protein